jgi:predicted amidophosphoribosyltransferase
MFMAYCHNCGEKLPKDASFCSNCGTKTAHGTEANASTPSEDMRQAFAKMSVEIEKAFSLAAKEIQVAFQTARENIQQSMQTENVVCGNCAEKNPGGSVYCFKCGQKIEPANKEKKQ